VHVPGRGLGVVQPTWFERDLPVPQAIVELDEENDASHSEAGGTGQPYRRVIRPLVK
jgi:hypothetical protein